MEDWDPFSDPSKQWEFEVDRERFVQEQTTCTTKERKQHYSTSSNSEDGCASGDPFAIGEIVLTPFGEGVFELIHVHIQIYKHTYIHTYAHTHIQTYLYTYIHPYTHTHTYSHTYLHKYKHTYTFIYLYI